VLRAHGVTQIEVANRLGISRQSLDKSLNRNMTTGRLEEIAEAIGVSPAEFYEPTTKTPQANAQGVKCPHCGADLIVDVREQ
jgi:transcriptional regulator with XRE-family HTH domain